MKNITDKKRSQNLIISSLVWAIVILMCSSYLEEFDKNILYILMSGFFIEFLRISSSTYSKKPKE